MQDGADRIRQIILSLRNFFRMDESDMKAVDIHAGIDSTLVIVRNRLTQKYGSEIEVIKSYGSLPLIECYPSQLNQVFMNILVNAIDTLNARHDVEEDHQPRITISTEIKLMDDRKKLNNNQPQIYQGDRSSVAIEISDNGSGIPEKVKQRIFDPFFTPKPMGKGTGLGLSISYQIIVEKHGGILECFSEPGQGTTVWIEIPVRQYAITLKS